MPFKGRIQGELYVNKMCDFLFICEATFKLFQK